MIWGDFKLKFGLFWLFIWLLIISKKISRGTSVEIGARVWPQSIIIVLILLTGIMLVEQLYQVIKNKNSFYFKTEKLSSIQINRLVVAFLTSIAYIILLNKIGFIVCTIFIIIVFMYLMGYRYIIKALVISVVIVILITLIFGKLMFVPLPRGYWIFREISNIFY